MKIGLAHKRLDLRGGTERDLYKTAEGLRDLGHEIHLFCCDYEVQPPIGTFRHNIPVLPLGRTARLWSFATLAPRITQEHKCDVVLGFGRMLQQDVVRSGGGTHLGFLETLGRESGARRRLWQGMSCYHRSLLAIEKRQFRPGQFKKVLAVSEEVKRDVVHHYSVPADQIVVLYNGVDQARFHSSRSQETRAAVRTQWNIPLDAPVVLFVGSGFRRKGLDRLLALWNSSKLQNSYLLIVGDDARIGRYKRWAETVSKERIIFTGRQEDVENYYAAADVVALPSVQEAFGNVVLEALSSGVPVVVSRSVGAAELLQGILADGIVNTPEDPAELEIKLLRVLEHARDSCCRDEARRLSEDYSWPKHFRRLEAVLAEVSKIGDGGNP
jgi:UDP-glucose:(heptosyl)LPS alpha-1,3-glucosyltransferase